MNFLVVNDDGISGSGLQILVEHLKKYGCVTVVAPDRGRSAASHSITIFDKITCKRVEQFQDVESYAISGTPADCVRLAASILKTPFDLVFSGMNDGLNLGTDVVYSGTVSAAREGIILGIPAVAISADDLKTAELELDSVLEYLLNQHLYSTKYVLNVNFPCKGYEKSKGIRFASMGIKRFKTEFKEVEEEVYERDVETITYDTNENTDVALASLGYITFVPLQISQTDEEVVYKLKNGTKDI